MPLPKINYDSSRKSAIPGVPSVIFDSPHDLSLEEIYNDIQGRIHVPDESFEVIGKDYLLSAEESMYTRLPRSLSFFGSIPEFCEWVSKINDMDTMGNLKANAWWHMFVHNTQSPGVSRDNIAFFLSSSDDFQPGEGSGYQDWESVRAIGYVSNTKDTYIDGLLGLCDLAYGVFNYQPTRLFLHGFLVHKGRAEQWIFDRSGLYCWAGLDLSDFERQTELLGSILGFRFFGDFQIGSMSLLVKSLGVCNIMVDGSFDLQFDRKPFHGRFSILSPEPICYRGRVPQIATSTRPWDHILKIKWSGTDDRREEDFLLQASTANIQGVATLVAHRKYDPWGTISLRKGHFTGKYRRLVRKSASGRTGIMHHSEPTSVPFKGLSMKCVVTTPIGRSLRTFTSVLQLRLVLRDAIKAHRSLLQSARILHQDISIDNILIVDDADNEERPNMPRGMLIDLDGAMSLDIGPKRPGELIGTKLFMAIGLLNGERHTYRHDLESFLYVLLTAVITGGNRVPPESTLMAWTKGSFEECAAAKMQHMTEQGFGALLEEIPEQYSSVRSVAENLRKILFPVMENGEIGTGTDEAKQDVLYDAMISEMGGDVDSEWQRQVAAREAGIQQACASIDSSS